MPVSQQSHQDDHPWRRFASRWTRALSAANLGRVSYSCFATNCAARQSLGINRQSILCPLAVAPYYRSCDQASEEPASLRQSLDCPAEFGSTVKAPDEFSQLVWKMYPKARGCWRPCLTRHQAVQRPKQFDARQMTGRSLVGALQRIAAMQPFLSQDLQWAVRCVEMAVRGPQPSDRDRAEPHSFHRWLCQCLRSGADHSCCFAQRGAQQQAAVSPRVPAPSWKFCLQDV